MWGLVKGLKIETFNEKHFKKATLQWHELLAQLKTMDDHASRIFLKKQQSSIDDIKLIVALNISLVNELVFQALY